METLQINIVYLILMMLIFFSVTGCVYRDDREEDVIKMKMLKMNRKLRSLRATPETYDENIKKSLWKFTDTVAGPFNISNTLVKPKGRFGGDPKRWSYEDQKSWSTKFPNCNGNYQSPINIRNKDIVKEKGPCFVWKNYGVLHPQMNISNSGYTVEVCGPWGNGKSESQPVVSGGPLKGEYKLDSVHWHWGYDDTDGSEHAINSKKEPLEMQFVHFNTKYSKLQDALLSDDPEAVAIFAILFTPSTDRLPLVTAIIQTLERARRGKVINPPVLPLSIVEQKSDNYFTYVGSFNVPPCAENVRWIVLTNPLPITSEFLDVFRSFQTKGKPLVDNYRNLQQLNKRIIHHHNGCLHK